MDRKSWDRVSKNWADDTVTTHIFPVPMVTCAIRIKIVIKSHEPNEKKWLLIPWIYYVVRSYQAYEGNGWKSPFFSILLIRVS